MELVHRRLLRWRTSLAIILCLATTAAWPYSYWRADGFGLCTGPRHYYFIATNAGALTVGMRDSYGEQRGVTWYHNPTENDRGIYSLLGFQFILLPRGMVLGIPIWLCAFLFAYLALRCFRRLPIPIPGYCPNCGYDLRATPARCPECGTIPPQQESISN